MNPTPQKTETAQKEESLLQFWREHNVFQKTLEKTLPSGRERKEYIFYEGPPGANGKPMLHHFEARAFKDVILHVTKIRKVLSSSVNLFRNIIPIQTRISIHPDKQGKNQLYAFQKYILFQQKEKTAFHRKNQIQLQQIQQD